MELDCSLASEEMPPLFKYGLNWAGNPHAPSLSAAPLQSPVDTVSKFPGHILNGDNDHSPRKQGRQGKSHFP